MSNIKNSIVAVVASVCGFGCLTNTDEPRLSPGDDMTQDQSRAGDTGNIDANRPDGGCTRNQHCTDSSASKCVDGACTACSGPVDCFHLSLDQCVDGECQECTPASAATDCDQKVCDPTTFTCTDVSLKTGEQCETCAYDDECRDGLACVMQGDMSFCLQKRVNDCAQPYTQINATSVNGIEPEEFCAAPTTTDCIAVLARLANTPCDTAGDIATDCGSETSRCEEINQNMTCTYLCRNGDDCPTSDSCVQDGEGNYCG